MSNAKEYLDKTAKLHGFNAKGYADFQKAVLDSQKAGGKALNKAVKGSKQIGEAVKNSEKKMKGKMKNLKKDTAKKSLMYGAAGGVGGSTALNHLNSKDDSL